MEIDVEQGTGGLGVCRTATIVVRVIDHGFPCSGFCGTANKMNIVSIGEEFFTVDEN